MAAELVFFTFVHEVFRIDNSSTVLHRDEALFFSRKIK